jgi:hypothetical protein
MIPNEDEDLVLGVGSLVLLVKPCPRAFAYHRFVFFIGICMDLLALKVEQEDRPFVPELAMELENFLLVASNGCEQIGVGALLSFRL